jgi:hypothetical protein
MPQIEINCDCGTQISGTSVFPEFNIVCGVCGRNFIESIDENMERIMWSVKDGVVTEWLDK